MSPMGGTAGVLCGFVVSRKMVVCGGGLCVRGGVWKRAVGYVMGYVGWQEWWEFETRDVLYKYL